VIVFDVEFWLLMNWNFDVWYALFNLDCEFNWGINEIVVMWIGEIEYGIGAS